MTAPENGVSDESEDLTRNYSDDQLIFKELYSKCSLLESQIVEMLDTKQNLLALNEKCENVSRRLLKIKSDCEYYKAHLGKSLHNMKVTMDKQKIMSRKKLDEFLKKRKQFEDYFEMSPIKYKLEKLISGNRELEKECKTKTDMLRLTKKENDELVSSVMQTFKGKVCEFSEVALRFKRNQ